MLALSEKGDNASVDMLVGDIYGQDYGRLGLKSTTIASSFGKVFSKKSGKKGTFSAEDISKSLLYAVSNNIGQIACVSFTFLPIMMHGSSCPHGAISISSQGDENAQACGTFTHS
jgi:pantothenate kinase